MSFTTSHNYRASPKKHLFFIEENRKNANSITVLQFPDYKRSAMKRNAKRSLAETLANDRIAAFGYDKRQPMGPIEAEDEDEESPMMRKRMRSL